jgi:hypothetical protein
MAGGACCYPGVWEGAKAGWVAQPLMAGRCLWLSVGMQRGLLLALPCISVAGALLSQGAVWWVCSKGGGLFMVGSSGCRYCCHLGAWCRHLASTTLSKLSHYHSSCNACAGLTRRRAGAVAGVGRAALLWLQMCMASACNGLHAHRAAHSATTASGARQRFMCACGCIDAQPAALLQAPARHWQPSALCIAPVGHHPQPKSAAGAQGCERTIPVLLCLPPCLINQAAACG